MAQIANFLSFGLERVIFLPDDIRTTTVLVGLLLLAFGLIRLRPLQGVLAALAWIAGYEAAWQLTTEPIQGGEASLTISYRERTGHVLDISAVWWLDDPVSRTRRLRSDKVGVWERRGSSQALRAMLEEGLARINGWTGRDLGPPRGPYPQAPDAGHRPGSRSG